MPNRSAAPMAIWITRLRSAENVAPVCRNPRTVPRCYLRTPDVTGLQTRRKRRQVQGEDAETMRRRDEETLIGDDLEIDHQGFRKADASDLPRRRAFREDERTEVGRRVQIAAP